MIRSVDLVQSEEQRALYARSPVYHHVVDLVRRAKWARSDTDPIIREALVSMATTIERLVSDLVAAHARNPAPVSFFLEGGR